MADAKKILVVLAHPDDESFGMGGTIAHYTAQGIEVHLICATRGEVGTVNPEFLEGYESIAELREAELRCAAEKLGISSLIFLGYRDSGMPGSPDNEHPGCLAASSLDEVASKVTHYIRKIRPNVMVTFDPNGGYFHPDHIKIHQAAVAAYTGAGDPTQYPNDDGLEPYQPEKLYYMVFPRGILKFFVAWLKLIRKDPTRFGRNNDVNLEVIANAKTFPVHVNIKFSEVKKQRQAANACHASQMNLGGDEQTWLLNLWVKLDAGVDHFMQAFPKVNGKLKKEDLFYS